MTVRLYLGRRRRKTRKSASSVWKKPALEMRWRQWRTWLGSSVVAAILSAPLSELLHIVVEEVVDGKAEVAAAEFWKLVQKPVQRVRALGLNLSHGFPVAIGPFRARFRLLGRFRVDQIWMSATKQLEMRQICRHQLASVLHFCITSCALAICRPRSCKWQLSSITFIVGDESALNSVTSIQYCTRSEYKSGEQRTHYSSPHTLSEPARFCRIHLPELACRWPSTESCCSNILMII